MPRLAPVLQLLPGLPALFELARRVMSPAGQHNRVAQGTSALGGLLSNGVHTQDRYGASRGVISPASALQESEEQLRQLANNIPQVFWIFDQQQNKTIYIRAC
jgi:PAS domain-containing protein